MVEKMLRRCSEETRREIEKAMNKQTALDILYLVSIVVFPQLIIFKKG